ncbi:helix-turn-helix transcriptional regulator [Clostridium sp.]|uniref:helix-turn-helix transcriptional regulator n=1 Tax=Clostridium sp. TaxID=1506 RepID=UPI0039937A70
MPIKNRLLEIRLKLGYKKQDDFAKYLEINRTQYNLYENNKKQPKLEILCKISKKLNIKLDDLIEFEEE